MWISFESTHMLQSFPLLLSSCFTAALLGCLNLDKCLTTFILGVSLNLRNRPEPTSTQVLVYVIDQLRSFKAEAACSTLQEFVVRKRVT